MRTLFNSAVTLQDAMARSHNLARYIELEPIIGNISYLQLILQALDESLSLNMTYRHNYDLDAEEELTVTIPSTMVSNFRTTRRHSLFLSS